mmetsp:Transcript_3434/g.6507  ORF Transcript_3434/g.6507 Transcript_3434/m.6507 type:complete len:94 (-) Transcript_3434:222-503(-)
MIADAVQKSRDMNGKTASISGWQPSDTFKREVMIWCDIKEQASWCLGSFPFPCVLRAVFQLRQHSDAPWRLKLTKWWFGKLPNQIMKRVVIPC